MVIGKQRKAEKVMYIILFKVYFLVLWANSVSSKEHRNKGGKKRPKSNKQWGVVITVI